MKKNYQMKKEDFHKIKHLQPELSFNSDAFYQLGGSFLRMERKLYNEFEKVFKEDIKWQPDPDGIFNEVPVGLRIPNSELSKDLTKTLRMRIINDHVKKNIPKSFKDSATKLLLSDQLKQLHAMFDIRVKFIDLWQGSEGCVWHWDGTDSADALILAYFSDHKRWDPSLGGQLEIGRRTDNCIGNMGLYTSDIDDEQVESIGFIPPAQQSLVVVNNQNPYLLHRCNLLASKDLRRVTLTMGLDFVVKDDPTAPAKVIWD